MCSKEVTAMTANTILYEAIVSGIARASELGFTKPGDVALIISTAIDDAGLKVIRTKK